MKVYDTDETAIKTAEKKQMIAKFIMFVFFLLVSALGVWGASKLLAHQDCEWRLAYEQRGPSVVSEQRVLYMTQQAWS